MENDENRQSTTEIAGPLCSEDGTWIGKANGTANSFAVHFILKFSSLNPPSDANPFVSLDHSPEPDFTAFKPMTIEEVMQIIRKMRDKKAPVFMDLINGRVLKELPRKCLALLTIIFNRAIHINDSPIQ